MSYTNPYMSGYPVQCMPPSAPAYSEIPYNSGPNYSTISKPKSPEEQDRFLKDYNFFVLIDKSSSMKWEVAKDEEVSRWETAQEYLSFIVGQATQYDRDGVDVCFFGSQVKWEKNVESEDTVKKVFEKIKPRGGTNLNRALEETYDMHVKNRQLNGSAKSIVLVITDGSPDNEEDVKNTIVRITNNLAQNQLFNNGEGKPSSTEFGIRFFQVGEDQGAKDYLDDLDNNLREAKYDIVATGDIENLSSAAKVRQAFIDAIFD